MFAIIESYNNIPLIIFKGTYEECLKQFFDIVGKEWENKEVEINGRKFKNYCKNTR